MLKGKSKPDSDAASQGDAQQFKENPQVNARIDEYIKNNPKFWTYVQSMPPERMARALVLVEIQKEDRTQKMRAGILKKLEQNPEMKQSIQNMVKNMPEEERERAMISIAARTMKVTAPRPAQAPSGARV
jgi:hypothetical protein